MVAGLSGQHIVKVACGSGDAHTLCITSQGKLYSWGDGDYGKLGRGGSDGSKVPRLVEKLQDVEITDVYCGPHFSIALSKEGTVYSWGKVITHLIGTQMYLFYFYYVRVRVGNLATPPKNTCGYRNRSRNFKTNEWFR